MVAASGNFAFLTEPAPRLARLGALAERYFVDDAATALVKLRQLGEFLAKDMAAHHGLLPSTSANFDDTLHRHLIDDPAGCENFVPVTWAETVPLDHGIREGGLFGNQNTVCRPRTPTWRHTVERLKVLLPNYDRRG